MHDGFQSAVTATPAPFEALSPPENVRREEKRHLLQVEENVSSGKVTMR
jgi:hypothetical protein